MGLSAHDFTKGKLFLTGEVFAKLNNDTGGGVQLQGTFRVDEKIKVNGGYAYHSGISNHRFFVGADYEVFPDYRDQPRVSVKGLLEAIIPKHGSRFSIGLAPVISKGIAVDDKYLYPFISLPIFRNMGSYKSFWQMALGLGTTLNLNSEFIINFEANIELKDYSSSILLGISKAF